MIHDDKNGNENSAVMYTKMVLADDFETIIHRHLELMVGIE